MCGACVCVVAVAAPMAATAAANAGCGGARGMTHAGLIERCGLLFPGAVWLWARAERRVRAVCRCPCCRGVREPSPQRVRSAVWRGPVRVRVRGLRAEPFVLHKIVASVRETGGRAGAWRERDERLLVHSSLENVRLTSNVKTASGERSLELRLPTARPTATRRDARPTAHRAPSAGLHSTWYARSTCDSSTEPNDTSHT